MVGRPSMVLGRPPHGPNRLRFCLRDLYVGPDAGYACLGCPYVSLGALVGLWILVIAPDWLRRYFHGLMTCHLAYGCVSSHVWLSRGPFDPCAWLSIFTLDHSC